MVSLDAQGNPHFVPDWSTLSTGSFQSRTADYLVKAIQKWSYPGGMATAVMWHPGPLDSDKTVAAAAAINPDTTGWRVRPFQIGCGRRRNGCLPSSIANSYRVFDITLYYDIFVPGSGGQGDLDTRYYRTCIVLQKAISP